MATILPFTPRPRSVQDRPQDGAATIVIFPGVRYEAAPGAETPVRRDRPKRATGRRKKAN